MWERRGVRLRALPYLPARELDLREVLLRVRDPHRGSAWWGGLGTGAARADAEPTTPATVPLPDLEAQFATMRQAMPAVLQGRLLAEADGENRLLTVLFSDLTGSVKAIAQLAPEDAASLVNGVLKAMIDAALEQDGRISRLLGDGMLALFGTPQWRKSRLVLLRYL